MKNAAAAAALLGALAMTAAAQEQKQEKPQSAPLAQTQTQPAAAQPAAQPAPAQPQTAQPPAAPAQPQKTAKAMKSKMYGTVQTVDAANKKIAIKTKKGDVKEISVGDGTAITKGGNRTSVALTDLKEGNKVEVRMEGEMVKTIHVQVAPK